MNDINLSSVRKLVSRIEAEIVADGVAAGSILGTESELCARYGVSPTIFRQAARILAAAGLAMTRRGNGGGLVVHGHSMVGAAKTIAIYLEFRGATNREMLPVSGRLFHLGVRLASERMTLAAADRLRGLFADISAAPFGFDRGMRNLELNQQIVAGSGNPVLALFYGVAQHFFTTAVTFRDGMEAAFLSAEAQSGELLEALIACDRERLPALIERSVAANRRNMEAATIRKPPDHGPAKPPGEPYRRTLSDQVSHRMLQEILRLGWPVGGKLGAEPELMARYGVSRATLRQAVRQLEQHFAVCSRRGPGGGIFISAPVEERVLSVAAAALRLSPAGWRDVQGVMPDLVGLAVDTGLQRAEGRRLLLQGLQAARDEANPGRAIDITRHALKAGCGNTVVAHFLEMIAQLDRPPPEPGEDETGEQARRLIAQAVHSVETGDHSRAKRALLDLTNAFGLSGQAAPPHEAQRDQLEAS